MKQLYNKGMLGPLAIYISMMIAMAFTIHAITNDITYKNYEQLKFHVVFLSIELMFITVISYIVIREYVVIKKKGWA